MEDHRAPDDNASCPAWVLLAVEARSRGFRNVLAFQPWCRRRGVPIRPDDGQFVRWITHAPPRTASDDYTRAQWKRRCEEIVKLRIELKPIVA